MKPTFQAIWGFSEHVQAEAEELMIGLGGDGGSGVRRQRAGLLRYPSNHFRSRRSAVVVLRVVLVEKVGNPVV